MDNVSMAMQPARMAVKFNPIERVVGEVSSPFTIWKKSSFDDGFWHVKNCEYNRLYFTVIDCSLQKTFSEAVKSIWHRSVLSDFSGAFACDAVRGSALLFNCSVGLLCLQSVKCGIGKYCQTIMQYACRLQNYDRFCEGVLLKICRSICMGDQEVFDEKLRMAIEYKCFADYGLRLLNWAVEHERERMVLKLLEVYQGYDPSFLETYEKNWLSNPLLNALRTNNLAVLGSFLRMGVNLNYDYYYDPSRLPGKPTLTHVTPLTYAIHHGLRDEIIQCLLDNGANADLCSECLGLPLNMAISRNHEQLVKKLIAYGANVNSHLHGITSVQVAFTFFDYSRSDLSYFYERLRIVNLIFEAGISVNNPAVINGFFKFLMDRSRFEYHSICKDGGAFYRCFEKYQYQRQLFGMLIYNGFAGVQEDLYKDRLPFLFFLEHPMLRVMLQLSSPSDIYKCNLVRLFPDGDVQNNALIRYFMNDMQNMTLKNLCRVALRQYLQPNFKEKVIKLTTFDEVASGMVEDVEPEMMEQSECGEDKIPYALRDYLMGADEVSDMLLMSIGFTE